MGFTRQNYYKRRKAREARLFDDEIICQRVEEVRAKHPRLGTRKIYDLIVGPLADHGIVIGRDRLFKVLGDNGKLIKQYRSKNPKTTRYDPSLPCFTNLIKELDIVRINQVWVSDITYISTALGFVYLSLIMDVFSRKIVGYHVSDSLSADGCLKALQMAGRQTGATGGIHHSDRGCQYASHRYVDALRAAGFEISMTETRHCYENAKAERLNGILKQEYGLDGMFADIREVARRVARVVELYNDERPHTSLKMKTPSAVYAAMTKAA